jgi:hypothetical protein
MDTIIAVLHGPGDSHAFQKRFPCKATFTLNPWAARSDEHQPRQFGADLPTPAEKVGHVGFVISIIATLENDSRALLIIV